MLSLMGIYIPEKIGIPVLNHCRFSKPPEHNFSEKNGPGKIEWTMNVG